MDLTGQLSNLPETLQSLLNQPLERRTGRVTVRPHRPLGPLWPPPEALLVRDTIIAVLEDVGSELRLMELRQRVEQRLDFEVPPGRFKAYMNDRCRGKTALFERLGYGRYRLRS